MNGGANEAHHQNSHGKPVQACDGCVPGDVETDFYKEFEMLTHARLLEFLDYCPATGIFTRKTRRGSSKSGDPAGRESCGYILINVDAVTYGAHRLAVFYVTGEMPLGEVDHRNGVKDDNRFSNLRAATHKVNTQNEVRARKHSSTGFLGVSTRKNSKKFVASILLNGKTKHLGMFATAELAHAAYLSVKRKHHEGTTL
ncbi:MAG: HNH endonuclease [Telluria sp.]